MMTYEELQQRWSAGHKAEAARGLEQLLETPQGAVEPAVRYNCAWTLACMYYYGDGVPRDEVRARALHARARAIEEASESQFDSDTPWSGPTRGQLRDAVARAEAGDVGARHRAGQLCLEGCSPQSYFLCDEELVFGAREAAHHFHMAALRGHAASVAQLLHILRGAVLGLQTVSKWGDEMMAAFDVLESIANAGNAECRRLVDGIYLGEHDPTVAARANARLEALAGEGSAPAMRALARVAWMETAPDPAAALKWLQRAEKAGDTEAAGISRALTLAIEVLGKPSDPEKSTIAGMLGPPRRSSLDDPYEEEREAPSVGDRIFGITGCYYLQAEDPRRRRFLGAAAQHGSALAAALLFKADFDEAPDKAAFLRARLRADDPGPQMPPYSPLFEDLSQFHRTLSKAYFALALGIEEGAAPDLAECAMWCWRGMLVDWRSGQPATWTAKEVRALAGDFCYHAARRLDPRVYDVNDDPARAVRWYVRGLEHGDVTCLGVWVNASLKGALGLSPDPQAALGMAERWRASGSADDPVGCRNEIRQHAEKLADRAAAAAWIEVAKRLEK